MHSPQSSHKKTCASLRLIGTTISSNTVSGLLSKEFGLKSYRPARKRYLTRVMTKRDWTLTDFIVIGLSLSGTKCCFMMNAPCNNLYLAACTLDGNWIKFWQETCYSHNEIPTEPNDLECHVVPWQCWSVFNSA